MVNYLKTYHSFLRTKNEVSILSPFRRAMILLFLLLILPLGLNAKKPDDIFLKTEISNHNPYEGEAVVYSTYLYSKSSDIAYVRRVEDTKLIGGAESYLSRIETDSRGHRENIDGESYFVFPLESYVVSIDKKGNYSYKGGGFEIGIRFPVVYEDPFWGRRRAYKTEDKFLSVPDVSFKVKKLPLPENVNEEGGTVGSFTISTEIPPGDIILDQPARALIKLRGRGLLDGDVLPEYIEAFRGDKIRLKSMSESRNLYFDGKSVVSELTLDCEFIPLEMDAEIGEVKFRFFNPIKGKYEEAKSPIVKVDVKSITTKIETVEI